MKPVEAAVLASLGAALTATPALAQSAPVDQRPPAAVAVQTALERVCLPVLGGKPMKAAASAAGVQENDSGWWLAAGGKQGVAILPPDSVNPHVCSLTVTYQAGQGAPLYTLLDRWSADHGLKPVKVKAASQGATYAHVTSSWEGQTPQGEMAVVLNAEKGLNGAPAANGENQATVLLSLTPASHAS
jgi:hypothetical protein